MKFLELAKKRRSIRKYQPKSIPGELLEKILQAVRIAPTAANKQPIKFFVVRNPEKYFGEFLRQKWALEAPVIIVAFAIPEQAWIRKYDGINYGIVDVAITFDHLTLAAADEGLATCWIAANDPEKIKQALQVPDSWQYIALTPLGYAAEERVMPERKPLEELVEYIE